MRDQISKVEEAGISELSDAPVEQVQYEYKARRFMDEGVDPEIGDLRVLAGPDTSKWRDILLSNSFADDIFLLDQLFSDNDYEAEMHVSRPAFRQVEYGCFPRPEPLGLMVAEDYDEFLKQVSHPFFHGMERNGLRTPKDSSIEVGFGSYEESEPVDLGLEYLDVQVPSFIAYDAAVIDEWAGDYARNESRSNFYEEL